MIKQHTFILLLLIPFYWCFLQVNNDNRSRKQHALCSVDSTYALSKYDFNYIKSKTIKLGKEVDVYAKPCSKKSLMPEAFISQYLSAQKIVIGDAEYLDPSNYDGFCFKQYKEFPTYNLFTFTYENGTCCKTLYAVTTKKDTLEVINMGVIGFTGDDSGWLGDKYGKWISEDIMDLMTISYYDDDFVEDNNNSRLDTTWSIIKIDKKGFLQEHAYKRVKYLEGRKIE